MSKILLQATDKGLTIPSEYNRIRIKQMVQDGITLFELTPRVRGSRQQQKYLEGAVIPAWAKWQYNLDPRKPENVQKARDLFKYHFWYMVIKDKDGTPHRLPKSLKNGHKQALDEYTSWAQENGAPIPNESLYKKWRDEYSMDIRWSNYYDWLHFLGLEEDSMPSNETFNKLTLTKE